MSRIQLTVALHPKNQENENLNEKRHSDTKMSQTLELSGKDFKVATIKVLQQSIKNSSRTNAKIKNLSKEIEVLQKNQLEMIKLKKKCSNQKQRSLNCNSHIYIF